MSLFATIALVSDDARAQNRPDQEYRGGDIQSADGLRVRGEIESQYYEYNNLDFRPLDVSSDQAILDSDDRGRLAFTGASFGLSYRIDPQLSFAFEAGHRGLWGNDQIGSVNEFGGFLYVPALYAEYQTVPDAGVRFRVGRQFFTIGGLGGAPDYVLADVLDMVRVDVPLGSVGSLTLVPLNVYATSDDLGEVNFVSLLGQQEEETFGFDGDTMTRRFGGVLRFDQLPVPIEATAYAFYSDVGAQGTGSDLSYDGLLGNFADNDWIANFGVRAAGHIGAFHPFGELAVSTGVDRKELVARDVDCEGIAYHLGVTADTRGRRKDQAGGLWGSASYFDAYGPAYETDGLLYSHGYVGMKGQQVGGTLLNRFMGWHPTAYLGRFGVSDNPQDIERIAGARVIHADGGFELPSGLKVWAGGWFLQDTGVSFLDFDKLDDITPPFGYTRSEFEAEERLGATLATEVNAEVGYRFGSHADVFVNGAFVSPGAFYRTEIDRVAGSALGAESPAPAWALYGGARMEF